MNEVQGPTVEVLYSCPGCAVRERPVEVPERGANEMVTDWLEGVVMAYVGMDHMATSPLCTYPKADLRLPYRDREHLGVARRQ